MKKNGNDHFLLLALIVDRDKTDAAVECMSDYGVFSTFTMPARGTAGSDILNMLGLGDSRKDIILSTLRNESVNPLLQKLTEEYGLEKPGRGIAFTLPLTGALYGRGLVDAGYLHEEEATVMEESNHRYELILAVTNSGYTDQVMNAAKSVHTVGGTIVKGRETGLKEGGKFFGVSIQPEKEILIMLVPKRFSDKMMAAIMKKAGPRSKAGTFAVTVPVKDTIGLSPEFEK